jgi:hypothetical protein
MIVRIPGIDEKLENGLDPIAVRQDYEDFFAFVSDLTNTEIKYLSQYYKALNDPVTGPLMRNHKNGRYMRINLTEPMFEIDLNKRAVTVPQIFSSGAIVRGDHMAEVLYFKVPRYFDEMDLGACTCEIECVTNNNGAQYVL